MAKGGEKQVREEDGGKGVTEVVECGDGMTGREEEEEVEERRPP